MPPLEASVHELLFRRDMESAQEQLCDLGTIGYFTHRSPDSTGCNQDSMGIVDCRNNAVVLIVADGVGGEMDGEKASAIAVESVVQAVRLSTNSDDLRPAILDGIEQANAAVLNLGTGSATTLAVVELHPQRMRGYHVGDSMTLLFGQRGHLKWRSVAHSPVGYAVESGLLKEAEAMFHEDRHLVSNLVGSQDMHIEVGPTCPLAPRDTILIASDGLFDNLHLEEVIELARRGPMLSRMEALLTLARHRMQIPVDGIPSKPDDLSVLMFGQKC